MNYKYENRTTRDAMARAMRQKGRRVACRSARNQTISPDYVADFSGTRIDNGWGGAAPTFFPVLYILEVRS